MSRNQNHELIMQVLYIELTHIAMRDDFALEKTMEDVFNLPFNSIDLFSRGVVIKASAHINEIVPILDNALEKSWKWKRISRIAQAILLMSYTHFHYVEKVDKAVVIEIAVKLAKKYLDQNDHKFINAVLDKVL